MPLEAPLEAPVKAPPQPSDRNPTQRQHKVQGSAKTWAPQAPMQSEVMGNPRSRATEGRANQKQRHARPTQREE